MPAEVTFDEQGNEVTTQTPAPTEPISNDPSPSPEPDPEPQEPHAAEPVTNQDPNSQSDGRYQIGDKFFPTLAEARAYAESELDAEPAGSAELNAYRQAILDAQRLNQNPNSVTSESEDDFDEDQFYSNPKEFLRTYGERIKQETEASITQNISTKAQSDKIWGEIVDRHPKLANFRPDIENIASQNAQKIQAIHQKKGPQAVYDWLNLQMQEKFEQYADAIKPRRTLPNTPTTGGPSGGTGEPGSSVTPKKQVKKPVSMAEQLRSIRKR